MLKMSVKPSEFSIVKPCSRFAVRSVLQRYRYRALRLRRPQGDGYISKIGTKQKRPVRFFQTGRFERNSFLNYGSGYKISFTKGSIQLFAATGVKISASAA